MILTDASAFIAICDKGQGNEHLRCVEALQQISDSFATPLQCLTEAMYFLHKLMGWRGQALLWQFIESDAFEIYHPSENDMKRMHQLMNKYKDTPMDFADASLVAAAESLETNKIFTLDNDFHIYRFNDTWNFKIIP